MAAPRSREARRRGFGAAAGWAVAVWAACGLTFAMGRAAFGIDAALAIHLAAAPAISFAATVLCWNHRRHPGALATAAVMAGVPAGLDALVVAPFLERSFAMFASPVGTWIPLALIFLGSLATARLLSRPPERRAFLGWMATPEEQLEPLPGDRWLAFEGGSTHAIGIAAAPAAVWPWLAQMGLGRAGWYSHDRLDNWGTGAPRPSTPSGKRSASATAGPPRPAAGPSSRSWRWTRAATWCWGPTWAPAPCARSPGASPRRRCTSAAPGASRCVPPARARRGSWCGVGG
jgi:hypothetical protein